MKYLTKRTFSIYFEHVMRHKVAFFVVSIGVAIGTMVNLVPPLLYKNFFDIISSSEPSDAIAAELIIVLLQVLGVFLISWALWRIVLFTNNYFQPIVMRDLSETCFNYLHRHAPSYFHNNFVGSLVKRVNRFSQAFEGMIDLLTFNALRIFIILCFVTVVLFSQNIYIGFGVVVWVILFFLLNYIGAQYKMKYDIERANQETKTTGLLADTITNHQNMKLLNGYSLETTQFAKTVEELRRIRKLSWDLGQTFETIQILLMVCLEFGLMYFAVQLWKQGTLSIGDFVLIQSYVVIIFGKLWDVGRYIRHYYVYLADAEEMTTILETPHTIVNAKGAKPLAVTEGNIVFEDVIFQYNKTRTILNHLDLEISAGQRVALVGHSGAGKSTIVSLLLRNYDVSSGSILIDGQRIDRITLESLWKQIAYVPQDPILFHRSLLENIRYGKQDATDEEVFAAARLAYADEFIDTFPEGYNTLVGERGVKLSGGERQRVAIARAILKNAPILILDEATSSLDSESESYIQAALDTLMQGKTVIVVAHRLSTIMKMDRIIVMEGGDIIEDGSHKQLLRKKTGKYRKLWDIQAGDFIGD